MDKFKAWLGIARPGGIDDIVVRAIKTGLVAFAITVMRRGLDHMDTTAWLAAVNAAWFAAGSVVLNALALLIPAHDADG